MVGRRSCQVLFPSSLSLLALVACAPAGPAPVAPPPTAASASPPVSASANAPDVPPGSFEDDLAFLRAHGEVLVLEAPGGGRVALSAAYQGRVMTSTAEAGGASYGFVNRAFIEAGKTGTQFDNYGGEDRFWLGPEAGPFGLYFAPGKPFAFAEWRTPDAFQAGAWTVKDRDARHVVFTRSFEVTNYAGTVLSMDVERTVRLLDADAVARHLGVAPGDGARFVAFETENRITNTGKVAWTKKGGLPSVWILAMYDPSPDTFVVVPFDARAKGEVVNDRYFGKVPADRLQVNENEGYLLFRCDGEHRSKIGLGPARARALLGSYSASARLLTIVHYDKPAGATDYVNSMWETQKEPFGGDVVNSYNDGPTEPGKPSLGGFYEIETSSPAAALAPGGSLVHTHRTFHFVGAPSALDPIAKRTLGLDTATLARGIAARP
ncbi:MAG: hypothetical protein IT373_14460 [Polyangiaceae bacterium]|nr:hypothetical protein [Polyangiaceae bacterium]